jgi:hypothetical protein
MLRPQANSLLQRKHTMIFINSTVNVGANRVFARLRAKFRQDTPIKI